MTPRRESLTSCLRRIIRDGMPDYLSGCPTGGWPETKQALLRIADWLPAQRSYTVYQFVDAVYIVDHACRYQLNDWGGQS